MTDSPERPRGRHEVPTVYFQGERLRYKSERRNHAILREVYTQSFSLPSAHEKQTFPVATRTFSHLDIRPVEVTYFLPQKPYEICFHPMRNQREAFIFVNLEHLDNDDAQSMHAVYNSTTGMLEGFYNTWPDFENKDNELAPVIDVDCMRGRIKIYQDEMASIEDEMPLVDKPLEYWGERYDLDNFNFCIEFVRDDEKVLFLTRKEHEVLLKATLPFKLWKNVGKEIFDKKSFSWVQNMEKIQAFSI